MKVLVVSNMYPSETHPEYGTFVKNFCNQLEQIGIEYSLSVMHKSNSKIKKISTYLKFYLKTFFKCLFEKYDIIYVHYPSYSAFPVIMANRLKKSNIYINLHGSDTIPITRNQSKMEKNTKKAVKISKKIIVPSEYFKKVVSEKYHIDGNEIYIYPSGGINEKIFYPFTEVCVHNVKHNLEIRDGKYLVGFVSRINDAKGWKTFIKAAFEICKCRDDIEFVIVGSGEDDNILDDMLNESGNNERFYRFPSQSQEKLAEIYNILDVYIFPTNSLSESLGLVAIEAMACGKPVIASDYAAPKYYVKDSVNGYKFERGNYRQLAETIIKYIDDRHKEVLVQGALQTAHRYSSKNVVEELKQIF